MSSGFSKTLARGAVYDTSTVLSFVTAETFTGDLALPVRLRKYSITLARCVSGIASGFCTSTKLEVSILTSISRPFLPSPNPIFLFLLRYAAGP